MNRDRVAPFVWLCCSLALAACGDGDKKLELGGSCSLNSDCADGLLCKFGACHKACVKSVDCATGERCVQVDGVAVCQMVMEQACAPNGSCPAPLMCSPADRICRNTCSPTSYCLGGQVCTAGFCVEYGEADAGQGADSGASGGVDAGVEAETGPGLPDAAVSVPDAPIPVDAPLTSDVPQSSLDLGSTPDGGGVSPVDTAPSSVCTPACTVGQECVAGTCQPCGRSAGQPCCAGTCDGNLTCNASNICVCGDVDQPCCDGAKCSTGLACESGICRCGGFGSACCAGNTCTAAGAVCAGLRCGCVQSCEDGFYWKTDGTFHGSFGITNADGSARTSATSLAIGYSVNGYSSPNACVVEDDATVWCQGGNPYGELGNGDVSVAYSSKLVQVITSAAPSGVPLTGINKVASGTTSRFFCAVAMDGGVWCWGDGSSGQLGRGDKLNSSFAVPVLDGPGDAPFTGVAALGLGRKHVCALKVDGTVWCWGFNDCGQLGTGSSDGSLYPTRVVGLTDPVVVLSTRSEPIQYTHTGNTCAIDSKGSAWCWGSEAGPDGDSFCTLSPVRLVMTKNGAAFTDAVQVDASTSRIRRSDGSLWHWDSTSVTPVLESNMPVAGSFWLGRDCWIASDGGLRVNSGLKVTCP
jgi:alpha-tubulin suppressor-like RCC1 family protein